MDGYIGPQTILAWQKKLGTPIDGTVSSPSAMVKNCRSGATRNRKKNTQRPGFVLYWKIV